MPPSKYQSHFAAVVRAGEVVLKSAERARMNTLARLLGDGVELDITVTQRKDRRSEKASNYYWVKVVRVASQHCGQSEEDIHDFWCHLFLPDKSTQVTFFHYLTGERISFTSDQRKTSGLSVSEFFDYVEQCRDWMREWMNVITEDPDPEFRRHARPQ